LSAGYYFIEKVVGAQHETIASAVFVGACLVSSGFVAKAKLRSTTSLVPDAKLTLKNFWELLAVFVRDLGDVVMGEHNRKYLPFVAAIFIYLAVLNSFGLIPGFSMPTDSVTFNLGIALVVFVLYNFWGIKEVGVMGYLKHLCGPVWWMAPLFILIELISHFFRPLSLSLRLFGNMTGDHLVLSIFTDLTKFAVPVLFYFLGLFVCFMQAFVFTLLTMVYIRFAVAHEEEH
jgi:F-type H+-transporting ATPase subunit a